MVTSQEIRTVLQELGITQKHASIKTKINESTLSEFINNKRILTDEQMLRLDDYIQKLKVIL